MDRIQVEKDGVYAIPEVGSPIRIMTTDEYHQMVNVDEEDISMEVELSRTHGKLSSKVINLYNLAPEDDEVRALCGEYIAWYNEGGAAQRGTPKWSAGEVIWGKCSKLTKEIRARCTPDLPNMGVENRVNPIEPVMEGDLDHSEFPPRVGRISEESAPNMGDSEGRYTAPNGAESTTLEFDVVTSASPSSKVSSNNKEVSNMQPQADALEVQVGNLQGEVGNTPTQVGSDVIFEGVESSLFGTTTQSTPSSKEDSVTAQPNLRTLIELNTSGKLSDKVLDAIQRAPDDPATENLCRRYWRLWNAPRSEGGRVESGHLFRMAERIIAANPTEEELKTEKKEAKIARRKVRVQSMATLANSLVDGVFTVMDKASESMGRMAEQSARNLGTVAGGVVTGATAGAREFNTARYQNTVAMLGDVDYQNLKLQAAQLKVMVRTSRREALRVAKAMAEDAVQSG